MTQTLLREKVNRYLAYAAGSIWYGEQLHCPTLLLLTTTATWAAAFRRAAKPKPLLDQYEHRYTSGDRSETPVVAACGLVGDLGRAVVEPCRMRPDPAAGEATLTEILAERLDDAQAQSGGYQDTAVCRRADIESLDEIRSFHPMCSRLN